MAAIVVTAVFLLAAAGDPPAESAVKANQPMTDIIAGLAAVQPGAWPDAGASTVSADQRVHVVTYMNEVNANFGYLQVSAAAHGLHPRILGYGDHAWWPDGLGAKINALREYVHAEVGNSEMVIFLDAFDVLVFGDREEMVLRFEALEQKHNRSLFFNAERDCFPDFADICTADYPESPNRQWRYLNSGAFVGRGAALKQMLRDRVDDIMPGSDQAFYQRYFLYFPERVGLDSECELLCATGGIGDAYGMEIKGMRMANNIMGTMPSIVHFMSSGHWPFWRDGQPTTVVNDVFQATHPTASERLFGVVDLGVRVGGTHSRHLLQLRGERRNAYIRLMRIVLCLQCRFLRSSDRECQYVPGIMCDMCADVRSLMELGVLVKIAVLLTVGRRSFHWVASKLPQNSCCARGLGKVAEMFSKSKTEKVW